MTALAFTLIRLHCLPFVAFCVLAHVASAQLKFTNPVHLSKKDGLPLGGEPAFAQDSKGFVWIATHAGLCRFDGSIVKRFKNVPGDTTSLADDRVQSLLYDKRSNALWVGTQNGLCRLDLATEKFKTYRHRPDDPCSLPHNYISTFSLYQDRQGGIWMGVSKQGVARYNRQSDSFDHFAYPTSANDPGERLQAIGVVLAILQDRHNDSLLWFGSGSGLLRFNKFTCRFIRFYHDTLQRRDHNSIRYLYQHDDGRLFISTWGAGVDVFDPVSKTFSNFSPTNEPFVMPQAKGTVDPIRRKSGHELWVGTLKGLSVFDLTKGKITQEWKNDFDKPAVYGTHFLDKDGRFWAWSPQGIFIYDSLNEQFSHFNYEPPSANRMGNVYKVLTDPTTGKLWVCASGGKGLYLLDRATGKAQIIPPPPSFFKKYDRFKARDMLFLRDGALLLVEESALFTLSPDRKSLVPFRLQPPGKDARFFYGLQDSKGRLWVSSYAGGVYRFDLATGEVQVFQGEVGINAPGKIQVSFDQLYEDSIQNIWMVASNGYTVFDSRRKRFFNFRLEAGVEPSFRQINGFCEAKNGILLIAGDGGIGVADPRQPEKGILSILDIPTKSIDHRNLLTLDKHGQLWFVCSDKLMRLSEDFASLETFDGHDGLMSLSDDPETVKITSLGLLPDGNMAVGYRQEAGISIFNPDSLRKSQELPLPYLCSFEVMGEELKTDTALAFLKKIELTHRQHFFSFGFSALGFSHPHRTKFRYKLEGVDRDWVYPAGGRHFASYSNLFEDKYLLRIMAANEAGVWNERECWLSITILPPWWATLWAKALYLLAVGGLFYGLWQYDLRRRLGAAEARHLRDLDHLKTRLYTNITHEFRTPLTVIMGLNDNIKDHERERKLIRRNSKNLLRLVNQMLDLSKLDSGAMTMDTMQADIIGYLQYLTESFHSMAAEKKVALAFLPEVRELVMDFDEVKMQHVMYNLLSNAIKFTPPGGRVKVVADQKQRNNRPWLQVKVEDNGAGIPQKDLPYIFDRFYQSGQSAVSSSRANSTNSSGTGIGLALTKELVELMGGKISVETAEGEGSVFTILVPVLASAGTPRLEKFAPPQYAESELAPNLETPAAEDAPPDDDRPHLLVIEDNDGVVTYIRSLLGKDYHLEVATDGRQGIEKALELVPDLIVSDVMMPEKDGFEVCQTLKTDLRTSHIPIILLTAKADVASKLEGLERGADAYLAKPFNKAELLVSIRKLLELRQSLHQYYRSLATQPATGVAGLDAPAFEEMENAFVQRVRQLAETHLAEPALDLPWLSRKLAMSRSQLYRKLMALTGHPPTHFIRDARLAKAKALLLQTELTVAEVAYETGFSDPGYFSKLFHKETGVSPGAFREAASKG